MGLLETQEDVLGNFSETLGTMDKFSEWGDGKICLKRLEDELLERE